MSSIDLILTYYICKDSISNKTDRYITHFGIREKGDHIQPNTEFCSNFCSQRDVYSALLVTWQAFRYLKLMLLFTDLPRCSTSGARHDFSCPSFTYPLWSRHAGRDPTVLTYQEGSLIWPLTLFWTLLHLSLSSHEQIPTADIFFWVLTEYRT